MWAFILYIEKATGVAGRVAEERGETQPGTGSVGYVVRGNSAFSKDTRLLFCTFGILLRQLQSDGALDSITHIVIDEVHERNLDGDVLMGLLREALKTVPHLKVILMIHVDFWSTIYPPEGSIAFQL